MWRWLGRLAFWLAWPLLFVYLHIGKRTRVVVLADNHILLVRTWMGDGSWSLPGGGLHYYERPVDGAVREVAEEAGLQLNAASLHLLGTERFAECGLTFTCHFFAAKLPKLVPLQKRWQLEILDAAWVPLANLDALKIRPSVRRALELLNGSR